METLAPLWSRHDRSFQNNRYVYPVLSRRAGGISVGINLNPDKGCNFDCVYCQVDRTPLGMSSVDPIHRPVEAERLVEELSILLDSLHRGDFFRTPPFDQLPPGLGHVADIAFSGDGEPTMVPEFAEILKTVSAFRNQTPALSRVPLRIITNGTGLFKARLRKTVREHLFLEAAGSGGVPDEIWFKIDAADEASYLRIDKSPLSFQRYRKGVSETLKEMPVTVQTMVLDIHDPEAPFRPEGLWAASMRDWFGELLSGGARIRAWHLYTVARKPPSPDIAPVSRERLLGLARFFEGTVTCPLSIFP